MHMDGENEIWQGRGSLVVTNTTGTKDLTCKGVLIRRNTALPRSTSDDGDLSAAEQPHGL